MDIEVTTYFAWVEKQELEVLENIQMGRSHKLCFGGDWHTPRSIAWRRII